MSTISVSGLSQLYQSVSSSPQVQATDSSATTDGSSSTATQSTQETHRHRHHGGAGGQAFFSKLQAAVTTALQAAKSGGATDPNQAVQNAIESVIKGGSSSSSDGSTPVASSTDASATQDASSTPDQASTTSSAVDPEAARQAFFQTLQSYGVDAHQFHQDFLSAIHDARNGQDDSGGAFKSFPPGSTLDETA